MLNGKNLVVWGPNGSGKSAVVDAVDFLLTGKISRLMGEGTAGISLKAHGPHIDHKPRESSVNALITIPGYEEPIRLRRTMSAPSKLEYPDEVEHLIRPILDLASRRQHVLSRREILRYVAAEAGKRSAEVQALLNLAELEDIRKAFGRVVNIAKTEHATTEDSFKAKSELIRNTIDLEVFSPEASLVTVNKLRAVLSGEPLTALKSTNLKANLVAPSVEAKLQKINPQLLRRDLSSLDKILDSAETSVANLDRELRTLLTDLRRDEIALREISKVGLFESGLNLIPDGGTCPLCGTPWPPGQLRKHLETHINSARVASEKARKIHSLADGIAEVATASQGYLNRLGSAAAELGLSKEASELSEWSVGLKDLIDVLKEPIPKYPSTGYRESQVARLISPGGGKVVAENIVKEAEQKVPPASLQQTAWDTLTRLEENWRQHEGAKGSHSIANLFFERAKLLEKCFEEARDQVLSTLYIFIKKSNLAFQNFINRFILKTSRILRVLFDQRVQV